MNEKNLYAAKVKFLSIVGLIAYAIMCFVLLIYRVVNPSEVMRPFHIIAVVVLEAVFFPLVRLIHYYGKKAGLKSAKIITNVITGFLLIILVFIVIICAKGMVVVS